MWIDLYLVAAALVAITAWLVGPRYQSYDPPGDVASAFWSAVAGALWPLVLVGAAQVVAVRYIARRLRPTYPEELDLVPLVAKRDVSVHS